jgi:4-amino-4-deoxy-L-arabinose transferase-like glycosyltransferase
VPALAWVIAALFAAAELAISGRYGFMQDELYFIVAGHHLALGYVDQPPLAPLLTRVTGLLGVSPTAIRIAPALAGAAVVVCAARLAALFGAGRAGRVLAALATACAPVVLALGHFGITEPLDLLAWAVVLACACTALLRDRPRWWLGAGVAAGLGLEANNLMVLLLVTLAIGLLLSPYRPVLATRWPWLGAGLAAAIWAPNVIWQAAHGWPEVAMASALRQLHSNSGPVAYAAGLPAQVGFAGLLVIPVVIAGMIRLWRTRELRFLAITATLLVVYVAAWIPGKSYYSEGIGPAVLAAGAVATERWIARSPRPGRRLWLAMAAPVAGLVLAAPSFLPVLPPADLRSVPNPDHVTTADTYGWPQFTAMVAARDADLARAGQRPTAIFTGNYAEAGALDVLGGHDRLPPVLSGQNTFWLWGPGRASDRVVLVIDAIGQLRPYFARCQVLSSYAWPDRVPSDYSGLDVGVCTGPVAPWPVIWPHLRRYD